MVCLFVAKDSRALAAAAYVIALPPPNVTLLPVDSLNSLFGLHSYTLYGLFDQCLL